MNDDRKRPGEWAPLFDAWTAASPGRGFADRVLAAVDGTPRLRLVPEPPPARAGNRAMWLAVAVAAALLALPFALHRHPSASHASSVAAADPSFDLGIERD